ncbi:hypothetical protein CYR40_20475 [Chimaeribacter arupi]|uniref:DUF7683 domain-containing protein n=3 Tax=Yersiniaceae TaxID=1903411 RepID=A0A2N5EI48_9GAMM|nr:MULTISPECIES: hypothetical protein [Yersiniaceae]MBS0969350.1 hypothetical protein [Nissabacter archeti]PLR42390.1 hypothetical protein CYR40_20475 [Chimaeribacter arupi]PLR44329.1 hypothetical protein CYR34_19110 [Chimaeribacter arupi]WKZ94716.1 hypothetical protein P0E69_22370 [Chimaeribacter arupi]
MISYSIEIFDKCSEELIKEIKIPNYQLDLVIEIMGFDTIEKESFIKGVGGFNVTKEQAVKLESLLMVEFHSEKYIIQIAGGEI